MVTSKFSFWNIYFVYALILGGFAVGCYLIIHGEQQFKGKLGIKTSGMVLGLIVCGLTIFFIYLLLKHTRRIRIEQEGISVSSLLKTAYISKTDISTVILTGRVNLGLFSNHRPTSAIIIELKTGEKLVFADAWYRNSAILKQTLQHYLTSARVSASIQTSVKDHPMPTDLGSMEKFAGNHFFNINGLMIYSTSIFWAWMAFAMFRNPAPSNGHPVMAGMVLLFVWALLVFAMGTQLHYFLLSANYLVVKNHVFLWKQKVFPLKNIREVVIETPYKRSITLTIITNDFSQKKYAAGSLRSKTWKLLAEKLRAEKISVTDET